MRVTDRSRIESYLHCPALRALRYHWNPATLRYDGLGIVPDSESNDLAFGKQVHAALAIGMENQANPHNSTDVLLERMLSQWDEFPYAGLTPDGEPVAAEYWRLFYGFSYTFVHYFREHLLQFYQPISMEQELTFPISIELNGYPDSVIGMARVDGAVRRRSDGMLLVLEWKTSSYIDTLPFQYEYALQTVIEVAALQQALDEHVGGVLLIGLDKGRSSSVSEKEKEAGLRGKRRISPFTYMYQQDNGFKLDRTPLYRKGWDRVLIPDPEEYMGFLEIEHPEIFESVFSTPHPLYVAPWQIERTLREIGILEGRIASGEEPLHNSTNCHNHQGIMNSVCPYVQICHHNEWDGFIGRTPHHALEATLLEGVAK